MSRGFVREDDQEELPIVPPRADLPDGQINYVTQAGLDQLIEERELLNLERENLDKTNEADYRIGVNYINAKLLLLNDRISSAHLINLEKQTTKLKLKNLCIMKLKVMVGLSLLVC